MKTQADNKMMRKLRLKKHQDFIEKADDPDENEQEELEENIKKEMNVAKLLLAFLKVKNANNL